MEIPDLVSPKAYTPTLCLRDVLDDVDDVQSVVCLVRFKDGSAQTYASFMHMQEMAYLAKILDRRIYNLLEESARG